MQGIHETQKCGTCRNFAWQFEMNPVKVGSEFHHPACKAVRASSPEQWEEAASILEKGEHHPAIKALHDDYQKVIHACSEALARSKRLRAVGVGRTEDPTFVLSMVEPAIRELAETATIVAHQMQQKFKG